MSQKRKKIDAEFKREAIRLADQPGKKDRQVEKDLGIYQGALRHWRKELAKNLLHAFPGAGHQTPLEEENRRL
ncbi:MAG: transposase, partial [Chitinivibrionales bacterium]|nr:transposase [Chitinivibrionales bacterium]